MSISEKRLAILHGRIERDTQGFFQRRRCRGDHRDGKPRGIGLLKRAQKRASGIRAAAADVVSIALTPRPIVVVIAPTTTKRRAGNHD
jgi:hypothetical protein